MSWICKVFGHKEFKSLPYSGLFCRLHNIRVDDKRDICTRCGVEL